MTTAQCPAEHLKRETRKPLRSGRANRPVSTRFPVFFAYLGFAVCSLVVAATLLELVSRLVLSAYHHFHRYTISDIAPDSTVYSGFPWARECIEEHPRRLKTRTTYFPFRIWGNTEWHGECVNNDATAMGVVRRTIPFLNPDCTNQPKTNIWVLGGSTVYGTLVPDWGTLPSYLSRELNVGARCVEVTNLGVEGYATNQELLLLMEELKTGRSPAAVIFYDGFNDADIGTSLMGPTAHMGFQTIKAHLEGSPFGSVGFIRGLGVWQLALELGKLLGRKSVVKVSASELSSRAELTLNNYEVNLSIARALGDAFGFKVCAFWQPAIIYGHKPLAPYEQQLLDLTSGNAYPFQALVPVYSEAKRRATQKGEVVFLGGIFDSVQQPLYLDWVHLSPAGNETVARAMAPYIRECLEK